VKTARNFSKKYQKTKKVNQKENPLKKKALKKKKLREKKKKKIRIFFFLPSFFSLREKKNFRKKF